jgi:[acyl-carrier-protein] S-malonyltransferase
MGQRSRISWKAWEAFLKDWVWVFPGQGAQYVGMGAALMSQSLAARLLFEEAQDILGLSLQQLCIEGPAERLSETQHSQPAIFCLSIAMLRALQERCPEIAPLAVAGLSLGEYTALVASGRLDFGQGLRLVHERASAMHEACCLTKGRMVSLLGGQSSDIARAVRELGRTDVVCANFNSPGQVVLSGSPEGIEAAVEVCRTIGVRRVVSLQVQGAFHSPLMTPAADRLRAALARTVFCSGHCPIALNVTGELLTREESIRDHLLQQMVSPVRWESCVHALAALQPRGFLEIGPGQTLSALIKRITSGAIQAMDSPAGVDSWWQTSCSSSSIVQ